MNIREPEVFIGSVYSPFGLPDNTLPGDLLLFENANGWRFYMRGKDGPVMQSTWYLITKLPTTWFVA